jgi:hypothetical protein
MCEWRRDREADIETNRPRDRQTGRQTDKRTYIQTDIHTHLQTDRQADTQIQRQTDIQAYYRQTDAIQPVEALVPDRHALLHGVRAVTEREAL